MEINIYSTNENWNMLMGTWTSTLYIHLVQDISGSKIKQKSHQDQNLRR